MNLLRKMDIARRDILRIDKIMREAPAGLARAEQLKPGFLQRLAAAADDLKTDVDRAEEEEEVCRQDVAEGLWVRSVTERLDDWADRLVDEDFANSLAGVIDRLPPDGASAAERAKYQKVKEDIALSASIYRSAKIAADLVAGSDFTPTERLDLLTRNDKQGKREALRGALSELIQLLQSQGPLTQENHGWAVLSGFLKDDINRSKSATP